jgi:hypothetical protein
MSAPVDWLFVTENRSQIKSKPNVEEQSKQSSVLSFYCISFLPDVINISILLLMWVLSMKTSSQWQGRMVYTNEYANIAWPTASYTEKFLQFELKMMER